MVLKQKEERGIKVRKHVWIKGAPIAPWVLTVYSDEHKRIHVEDESEKRGWQLVFYPWEDIDGDNKKIQALYSLVGYSAAEEAIGMIKSMMR